MKKWIWLAFSLVTLGALSAYWANKSKDKETFGSGEIKRGSGELGPAVLPNARQAPGYDPIPPPPEYSPPAGGPPQSEPQPFEGGPFEDSPPQNAFPEDGPEPPGLGEMPEAIIPEELPEGMEPPQPPEPFDGEVYPGEDE